MRVGDMVSDHALVHFSLHFALRSCMQARSGSRVERGAGCHMMRLHPTWQLPGCALTPDTFDDLSVDEMAQLYRTVMTDLLDQHCPVVRVRRKTKHTTPWFDSECRAERQRVRAAERRFLRTRVEAHRLTWQAGRDCCEQGRHEEVVAVIVWCTGRDVQ